MSNEKDVSRMRNKRFTFHSVQSKIYEIMQETSQEEEKCALIDYITVIQPHLSLPKQSPYLEIIKNG